jgi:hypothetical protein
MLSSQNIIWRALNPFQSGAENDEYKMSMPQQGHDAQRPLVAHHRHHHIVSDQLETKARANESFCLGWNHEDALNRTLQPFDLWWTHHPTWVIANETGDMFCVEPADETSAMMRNFTAFYQTQFESGCDRIHWRMMWSSGWGADLMNVQVSCAGIT